MTDKARQIARLRKLERMALSFEGVASETVSTPSGGTRSITYTSLADLNRAIKDQRALVASMRGNGGLSLEYPRYL